MEFYQLRSFVMVAEVSNLTRASERLHTSQPSVSAHIKSLEDEFGVILFKRTAKGMSLTSEGKIALKEVLKVIEAVENLERLTNTFKQEVIGEVGLGLNTDPQVIRVKELVQLLNEHYPGLKLHLKNASSNEILNYLKNQVLDAGFIMGDPKDEQFSLQHINTMHLNIVASNNFSDKIKTANKDNLRNMPWLNIPTNSPLKIIIDQLFNFQPVNYIETEMATIDDENTFNSLVGATSGLCLLREDLAQKAAKKGEIVIWEKEKVAVPLYFACLKSKRGQTNIEAIFNLIRQIWDIKSEAEK